MKIFQTFIFLLAAVIGLKSFSQQDTMQIYSDTLRVTALDTTFLDSSSNAHFSKYLIPGNNGSIISRFGPRRGRMHYGTDIKMNKGDTIVAVESGTIMRSNWGTGFGNIIIIKHQNDIETYYGHLSKFLKRKVKK